MKRFTDALKENKVAALFFFLFSYTALFMDGLSLFCLGRFTHEAFYRCAKCIDKTLYR